MSLDALNSTRKCARLSPASVIRKGCNLFDHFLCSSVARLFPQDSRRQPTSPPSARRLQVVMSCPISSLPLSSPTKAGSIRSSATAAMTSCTSVSCCQVFRLFLFYLIGLNHTGMSARAASNVVSSLSVARFSLRISFV